VPKRGRARSSSLSIVEIEQSTESLATSNRANAIRVRGNAINQGVVQSGSTLLAPIVLLRHQFSSQRKIVLGAAIVATLASNLRPTPLPRSQSAPIGVREIQFPVAKLFCSGNGNIEPSGSAFFLLTECLLHRFPPAASAPALFPTYEIRLDFRRSCFGTGRPENLLPPLLEPHTCVFHAHTAVTNGTTRLMTPIRAALTKLRKK
jgi:hypothetical protein